MSGLFDRLQNELDDKESEGGITALDLADLPRQLRKLMRLMLREVELSRGALSEAVQKMKEEERLSEQDLAASIKALVQQNWLIELGEGDNRRYRVNLRRKKGSELAAGIWNKLDARIEERAQEQKRAENDLPDRPEE